MKKSRIFLLLIMTAFLACRKDLEYSESDIRYPEPYVQVKTTIGGLVVDESGKRVAGATVRLGDKTTNTDDNGVFNFRDVYTNAKGAYVSVEHPGYFHGSRKINVSSGTRNTVKIQLLSNAVTRYINAASGGMADYTDYSVALPAGGISTAGGTPYTGQVGVAAKWLDPTSPDFGEQMPGRLQGVTTENQLSGMISMGMLAVELKDAAGNNLQIRDGFEATLRMKVPAALLGDAPATIPLWYFDEEKGLWMEEGEATLNNGVYEGKVKHFSFWNYDYKDPLVEIKFSVVDQNGNPVEGAKVHTTLPNTGLFGYGFTDNMGCIYGLVPKDEVLNAGIYPPNLGCSTPILQQQIGPFSQNGTYTFTINLTSVSTYTITGTLEDCDGNPVSNGYVTVNGQNDIFWTDGNGDFEVQIASCTTLTTVNLTGYDLIALKASLPRTVDVSSGSANAGIISVCNALQSYLTYAFGGQIFTNPNPVFSTIDSIPGGGIDYITVSTGNPTSLYIGFYIRDVNGTGSFSPDYFATDGTLNGNNVVHSCQDVVDCSGMTITITEFNGVGGVIQGTYSGTLKNNGSGQQPPPPVAVSGSFRGILQ
ncbi:MAG: carboxypeptidase-like regulatory domain-containing protein [Thermoanaerobaculia bacterium]|nr:carboxypeptidase-like regulatory domain-containing protein [Thermoanaerobaculia bacterium]